MTPKILNTAFKGFLEKFSGLPGVVDCPVFLGYPNKSSKPAGREFLVFSKLFKHPRSWGSDDFTYDPMTREDGVWTASALYYITYQVDSYGTMGETRLEQLRTAFNSGLGAAYFKQAKDDYNRRGLGVVRTGDIRDSTEKDGTPEYAPRCFTEFVVAARLTAHTEQDWLDVLTITLKGVQ